MGQYYNPTNIDKKQWLYTHDFKQRWVRDDGKTFMFGQGLKLMEHSYIGNILMNAVERLLVKGGAWYKNRVVWAGDYADNEKNRKNNLSHLIGKDKNKIRPPARLLSKKYRYIVNHSIKEFIDKQKIKPDKNGFRIHPLSLLTCEGNGRGGGDFHGDDDRIGTWSRDSISIEEIKPHTPEYMEIDGQFVEE